VESSFSSFSPSSSAAANKNSNNVYEVRGWSQRPNEGHGYVYTLKYAMVDGTAWGAGVEAVPISIERKRRSSTSNAELSRMISDSFFYNEKYIRKNGGPYAIPGNSAIIELLTAAGIPEQQIHTGDDIDKSKSVENREDYGVIYFDVGNPLSQHCANRGVYTADEPLCPMIPVEQFESLGRRYKEGGNMEVGTRLLAAGQAKRENVNREVEEAEAVRAAGRRLAAMGNNNNKPHLLEEASSDISSESASTATAVDAAAAMKKAEAEIRAAAIRLDNRARKEEAAAARKSRRPLFLGASAVERNSSPLSQVAAGRYEKISTKLLLEKSYGLPKSSRPDKRTGCPICGRSDPHEHND
jgi:hypothetical protein